MILGSVLGAAIFIIGGGMGVWIGILFQDGLRMALIAQHKREMDEIFEEVNRARAQVAMLIGKE
ncbi:MAG TPA: hypothetical protein VNZ53_19280 [Steroidobacteraceae bacterium]|jgi:hypothetical protein|nr:hypothetical protein [Steroidobacteraceae bacterium]